MEKITTQDVLKVIAAGGIIMGTVVVPPLPMILYTAHKAWKDVNKQDLGRIVKRLEKQQMIIVKHLEGKVTIVVTEKGKKRLLEYDFENIEIKKKRRDGKWRLIIFDIPEKKRNARDMFRRKLLQLGCIRLQDSIFVSAYPCKNEIDFLCNFLEISNFVSLVVLNKIERGEQLIFKEFKDLD